MIVNVNMSQEVYDYFSGYDMSAVADTLLEMYDYTNLPPTSGIRDKEVKINVSNESYIKLYNTLGPRSKKVSLGRLFEFAYNMNVLSLERFKLYAIDKVDDPVPSLLNRAYRALLSAQKYVNSDILSKVTEIIYEYMQEYKNKTQI